MGLSPAHLIEKAAEFLMRELTSQDKLNYSRFYDGTDKTHQWLLKELGLEGDWYSAEHLIDLAAAELADMGIVRTIELNSKLSDGEPDYRIEWTENGPDILASGKKLMFRDLE